MLHTLLGCVNGNINLTAAWGGREGKEGRLWFKVVLAISVATETTNKGRKYQKQTHPGVNAGWLSCIWNTWEYKCFRFWISLDFEIYIMRYIGYNIHI